MKCVSVVVGGRRREAGTSVGGLPEGDRDIVNAVGARLEAQVLVVLRLVLHHVVARADHHAAAQRQPVLAEFALVDLPRQQPSSHASEASEDVSTGVGAAAERRPGRRWRSAPGLAPVPARGAGAGACARAVAHASSSAPASAYVRLVSVVFIVE